MKNNDKEENLIPVAERSKHTGTIKVVVYH